MKKTFTRLQQLVNEVPRRLDQFSPTEMAQRPAPGKWSKKEILGHLCDSAVYNWQRFTNAQISEEPFEITPYSQEPLVNLNAYQGLPTNQIAALWANLNKQIIAVIKNLPEAKLAHPIQLPKRALTYSADHASTLRWLIEDYLEHLEHHLRQIFPAEKIPTPSLPANWKISIEEATKALAENPDSDILLTLLKHEKMYVEIYAPQKIDRQVAHEQDEIYFIISGTGTFFNNGERKPFQPGDLIFVPTGVEHRFEDFSDDFSTWVIFY